MQVVNPVNIHKLIEKFQFHTSSKKKKKKKIVQYLATCQTAMEKEGKGEMH